MNVLGWIGTSILLGAIIWGVRFGIRHHSEIEEMRPMKIHPHRGHTLRRLTERERKNPRVVKTVEGLPRPNVPVPMSSDDLEEMDSMFGSAGTDPSDY